MLAPPVVSAAGGGGPAAGPGPRRAADHLPLAPSISDEAISALLDHVAAPHKEGCRRMLRGEAFTWASSWQDWYIFHNHFSERLTWGDGTYLDIGTNQPIWGSNTFFFDACLGWRGICFEPSAAYHAPIRQQRSCKLVPKCVVGPGDHGVVMTGKGSRGHLRAAPPGKGGSDCADVTKVLPELLGPNPRVDFISIDIEGFEPNVLRCMPLEELGAKAILMETDKIVQMRPVDRFFHRRGYVSAETFTTARSVERGKPGSTAQYIDHLYVRRERPALYPPWQEPPRAGEKRHGCDPVHAKAVGANAHWCSPFQMWTPADPDGKWTTCKAQNFTVQYPY